MTETEDYYNYIVTTRKSIFFPSINIFLSFVYTPEYNVPINFYCNQVRYFGVSHIN